LPDDEREGIALCLSGGGFRAALFHLGAIRRLHELGVLASVRTIAAVSGGSVLAAFLAERCELWRSRPAINHAAEAVEEWDRSIATPFRAIASRNLTTIPALIGWLPWNWATNLGLKAVARACEARGITTQKTDDLPADPHFLFAATDLV